MRHLREILRLKLEGRHSNRDVARACNVSVGAVSGYLRRAQQAGLSWPLPAELDDGQLEGLLFPLDAGTPGPRPLPDLAELHRELRRGQGVTLQLLWLEYIQSHPDGYRYSQFCEHYRRFERKLSPAMRQLHRAGEKAFLDFAGQRPSIVDRATGEAVFGELFIGVLGASSYTYAEALPSQRLPDWIAANVRMLEFFGGAPEILVPDCLKSAITTPSPYEPGINRTYQELASHYHTAVIPARPGRARDKAKVEVAVQVAERWILAVLRKRRFFSFAEMNEAIWALLEQINGRQMKHLSASRRQLYERLDRPALRPLPRQRFEMAEWKGCGVNIDYHVGFDHNFYSVPHQLVGERVEARGTSTTVEVFFRSRRVAAHRRRHGRGQYSTQPEHMPASHRAHAEWSPSRLIGWASKTGPSTGCLVEQILRLRPHPEQGYRACLGIMRLGKKYGAERLEAACARACRLGSYSYTTIKNMLAAGLDATPLEPDGPAPALPAHGNVRGPGYYRKEENEC